MKKHRYTVVIDGIEIEKHDISIYQIDHEGEWTSN